MAGRHISNVEKARSIRVYRTSFQVFLLAISETLVGSMPNVIAMSLRRSPEALMERMLLTSPSVNSALPFVSPVEERPRSTRSRTLSGW